MTGETTQRAVITGATGRMEIDRYFWKSEGCTVVYADGRTERFKSHPRGHGMVYEAEEVMRCLRAGLVESPVIPHAATLSDTAFSGSSLLACSKAAASPASS